MRVISGSARRVCLKTLSGLDTRPTTDKIKETLFNILMPYIPGSYFLDLFAGSGGIGIEALSRGADAVVFVEKNSNAVKIIRQNLETTHFTEQSTVYMADFHLALQKLEHYKNKKNKDFKLFDLIFIDPPYEKELEFKVLDYLKTSILIDQNTLIVIEMSKQTNDSKIEEDIWECIRVKEYKNNKHIFLKRRF